MPTDKKTAPKKSVSKKATAKADPAPAVARKNPGMRMARPYKKPVQRKR